VFSGPELTSPEPQPIISLVQSRLEGVDDESNHYSEIESAQDRAEKPVPTPNVERESTNEMESQPFPTLVSSARTSSPVADSDIDNQAATGEVISPPPASVQATEEQQELTSKPVSASSDAPALPITETRDNHQDMVTPVLQRHKPIAPPPVQALRIVKKAPRPNAEKRGGPATDPVPAVSTNGRATTRTIPERSDMNLRPLNPASSRSDANAPAIRARATGQSQPASTGHSSKPGTGSSITTGKGPKRLIINTSAAASGSQRTQDVVPPSGAQGRAKVGSQQQPARQEAVRTTGASGSTLPRPVTSSRVPSLRRVRDNVTGTGTTMRRGRSGQ
jgi:hypothetical protein